MICLSVQPVLARCVKIGLFFSVVFPRCRKQFFAHAKTICFAKRKNTQHARTIPTPRFVTATTPRVFPASQATPKPTPPRPPAAVSLPTASRKQRLYAWESLLPKFLFPPGFDEGGTIGKREVSNSGDVAEEAGGPAARAPFSTPPVFQVILFVRLSVYLPFSRTQVVFSSLSSFTASL